MLGRWSSIDTSLVKTGRSSVPAATVDEALEFLGSIREARSYVKDHYPERS